MSHYLDEFRIHVRKKVARPVIENLVQPKMNDRMRLILDNLSDDKKQNTIVNISKRIGLNYRSTRVALDKMVKAGLIAEIKVEHRGKHSDYSLNPKYKRLFFIDN